MSWQAILQTLPLLTIDETEIFAPPREMETAIASYNRALVNLRHDSADVAQIALRKLVISYPLFGPASLLYGACLLEQHKLPAAAELIDRAKIAGLKPQENNLATSLLEAMAEIRDAEKPQDHPTNKQNPGKPGVTKPTGIKPTVPNQPIPGSGAIWAPSGSAAGSGQSSGSPILERTRPATKARMASRREVQNMMRHSDVPDQEPTRILSEKSPQEKMRLGVIVIGSLLVVIALFFVVTSAIRYFRANDARRGLPDDQARLAFLLDKLDSMAAGDPAVANLLSDYNDFIAPTTASQSSETIPTTVTVAETIETTPETSIVITTEPTSTSEAPVSTSPTDLLTQVYSEYQAALLHAQTDVVAAAESLLAAGKVGEGLDTDLKSPAVPFSVTELNTKIREALNKYGPQAAELLRAQGSERYDLKDYEASLDFYLRAYALQPLYYGGGVAYYCGRNYQALNQFELARPYYELVIQKFPGREIASFAAVRLTEMGYANPSPSTTQTPTTTTTSTTPATTPTTASTP